jgi:TonB family protein
MPIALLLAALVAGSVDPVSGSAATLSPPDRPITDAQWETAPSKVWTYYPEAAFPKGDEGLAVVECRVSPDRWLADCKVLAEQPQGGPFGQAALQIASRFRAKATTQSGAQAVGRMIRIPIAFSMPWGERSPQNGAVFQVRARPPWVKFPTGDDMARVYPRSATERSIEGGATLHCRFQADGHLGACSADNEHPAGEGFIEAVLKLALIFKIDTNKGIGPLAPGKEIDIPILFQLPRG